MFKKYLQILLFTTVSFFTCIQAENPFTGLAEQRLQCFDQPVKVEIKPEEEKKKKKTLDLNIKTLDVHTKHKELFRLLCLTDSKPSTVLNKNSWRDLEIAIGDHNALANLHNKVDCTQTAFGSDYLIYKLTHPIDSPEQLIFQQNSIKELLANQALFKQLDAIFAAIAQAENNFFFMYQEESPFNKKTISSFYFTSTWPVLRNLRALNSNATYLEGCSALSKGTSTLLFTWLPLTMHQCISRSLGTIRYLNEYEKKQYKSIYLGKEPEPALPLLEIIKVFLGKQEDQAKKDTQKILSRLVTPYPVILKNVNNFDDAKQVINQSKDDYPSWGDLNKMFALEIESKFKNGSTAERNAFWATSAIIASIQAYSIYAGINKERSYNNLTNYLHTQLISVATIIHAMKACSLLIEKNKKFADGLEHKEDLHALFDTTSKKVSAKLHKLVGLLSTNTFKGNASYFSLKGRVLAAYSLMQDVKDELAPALRALGEVETVLSTAKLYKKFEGQKVQFTFPTYLHEDTPSISISGMWNPFVPVEKVIENSITLGNAMPQNIILTGPNAGGKSTFLKGTCLSILLAQTIGLAPVKELAFTPFAKINTYMNITDDTAGGNSLFKSEVLRAQGLLESVKSLTSKHFSFSIMDEMFSGTSPKEGAAASYAVAKRLGEIKNSILLLATHFPLLTELETVTKDFKNYQVRVVRHDNGRFSYPFKLEEGIADQNVAMDILQQQGFDASILADATAVLNR